MDEDYLEDLRLEKDSEPYITGPDKRSLPILRYKLHILYLVENNNVVVIAGETGSGKSTQIPRFLYEAGWNRQICVVESRRIGAVSLAARLSVEIPRAVGYRIRFDDKTNSETRIVYVTDGVLLKEIQKDPLLQDYSVVILDDVHERTANMDLLLGLCKKILLKRPDLKIIITSATLDAESFLSHFSDFSTQALSIEGKLFPVDVYYLKEPCSNYIEKSIETVQAISQTQAPGDILVFLTGQEDISIFQSQFHLHKNLEVLPLYSSLPIEDQMKVFQPSIGKRKVIAATNIAETAVTIEGVLYVIDCCFCKMKYYKNGIEWLSMYPISKSQAIQRAGRAGRLRPGKCYRLCTENNYNSLSDSCLPEILRVDLSQPIIYLKTLGIHNMPNFPFMNPPNKASIVEAFELLHSLNVVDESGLLSQDVGKTISEFPINMKLAVMLVKSCSENFRCSQEMLSIVSMMSVQNIFSTRTPEAIVASKVKIGAKEGDHVTMLNILETFSRINNFNDRKKFCIEFKLNMRALQRAGRIKDQLKSIMQKLKLRTISCECDVESILRCLVTGLFMNAAQREPNGIYKTLKSNDDYYLHPSSVLNLVKPPWIVFTDVLQTDKMYLLDSSEIDADWLFELAPNYFEDLRNTKMHIQHKKLKGNA